MHFCILSVLLLTIFPSGLASPLYLLDEVSDFDDIVEPEQFPIQKYENSPKDISLHDGFKHDIKNRNSNDKAFSVSETKNDNGVFVKKLLSQREKDNRKVSDIAALDKQNINGRKKYQRYESIDDPIKNENMVSNDRRDYRKLQTQECPSLSDLLPLPLMESLLISRLLEDSTISKIKPHPYKYVVKQVVPGFKDTDALSRSENVNCFKQYLGTRMQQAKSLMRRRKRRKNRKIRSADQNQAQIEHIEHYILKNDSFVDSFTYIPLMFGTFFPNENHVFIAGMRYNDSEEAKSALAKLFDPATTTTSYLNETNKKPVNETIQEVRTLATELSFNVPEVNRTLMEVMQRQQILSDQSTRTNISQNTWGEFQNQKEAVGMYPDTNLKGFLKRSKVDQSLIPGVLIFPKRSRQRKRYAVSDSVEISAENLLQQIDLNSLLGKPVNPKSECEEETNKMMDILHHIKQEALGSNVAGRIDCTVKIENSSAPSTINITTSQVIMTSTVGDTPLPSMRNNVQDKLVRLQADLKLVDEIQGILNSVESPKKHKRQISSKMIGFNKGNNYDEEVKALSKIRGRLKSLDKRGRFLGVGKQNFIWRNGGGVSNLESVRQLYGKISEKFPIKNATQTEIDFNRTFLEEDTSRIVPTITFPISSTHSSTQGLTPNLDPDEHDDYVQDFLTVHQGSSNGADKYYAPLNNVDLSYERTNLDFNVEPAKELSSYEKQKIFERADKLLGKENPQLVGDIYPEFRLYGDDEDSELVLENARALIEKTEKTMPLPWLVNSLLIGDSSSDKKQTITKKSNKPNQNRSSPTQNGRTLKKVWKRNGDDTSTKIWEQFKWGKPLPSKERELTRAPIGTLGIKFFPRGKDAQTEGETTDKLYTRKVITKKIYDEDENVVSVLYEPVLSMDSRTNVETTTQATKQDRYGNDFFAFQTIAESKYEETTAISERLASLDDDATTKSNMDTICEICDEDKTSSFEETISTIPGGSKTAHEFQIGSFLVPQATPGILKKIEDFSSTTFSTLRRNIQEDDVEYLCDVCLDRQFERIKTHEQETLEDGDTEEGTPHISNSTIVELSEIFGTSMPLGQSTMEKGKIDIKLAEISTEKLEKSSQPARLAIGKTEEVEREDLDESRKLVFEVTPQVLLQTEYVFKSQKEISSTVGQTSTKISDFHNQSHRKFEEEHEMHFKVNGLSTGTSESVGQHHDDTEKVLKAVEFTITTEKEVAETLSEAVKSEYLKTVQIAATQAEDLSKIEPTVKLDTTIALETLVMGYISSESSETEFTERVDVSYDLQIPLTQTMQIDTPEVKVISEATTSKFKEHLEIFEIQTSLGEERSGISKVYTTDKKEIKMLETQITITDAEMEEEEKTMATSAVESILFEASAVSTEELPKRKGFYISETEKISALETVKTDTSEVTSSKVEVISPLKFSDQTPQYEDRTELSNGEILEGEGITTTISVITDNTSYLEISAAQLEEEIITKKTQIDFNITDLVSPKYFTIPEKTLEQEQIRETLEVTDFMPTLEETEETSALIKLEEAQITKRMEGDTGETEKLSATKIVESGMLAEITATFDDTTSKLEDLKIFDQKSLREESTKLSKVHTTELKDIQKLSTDITTTLDIETPEGAKFSAETFITDKITSLETSSIVQLQEEEIIVPESTFISKTTTSQLEQEEILKSYTTEIKETETLHIDVLATKQTSVFAKLEEENITKPTAVDIGKTDKMAITEKDQSETQKLAEISAIEESTEPSKIPAAELKETNKSYTDMVTTYDIELPEGATFFSETSIIDNVTSLGASTIFILKEEETETSHHISITEEVATKKTEKNKTVEVPESTFISKTAASQSEYSKYSTISEAMSQQEKLLKAYTAETGKMHVTEKEHSEIQELAVITAIEEITELSIVPTAELKETKKSYTATFSPQTSTSLETSSIVLLKEQGITETSQMYISITEQVPTKRTEALYTDVFATIEGKDLTSIFTKLEEEKLTKTTGVDISEIDKMPVTEREQSEMPELEEMTVIEESTELSIVPTAEPKETKKPFTATFLPQTSTIDSITSLETSSIVLLKEQGITETSQMYVSITEQVPTKRTETLYTDVFATTEGKDHTSVFAKLEEEKLTKTTGVEISETDKMSVTEREQSEMPELEEMTVIEESTELSIVPTAELKETKKSFTATFLPQTSTIDSIISLETSSIVLLKEQGITETPQMYISISEQVPTKRTETLYTDVFATTEGKDHTSVFAKLEEEKITKTTEVDISETDKIPVIEREQSEMPELEEMTVIEESTELSIVPTAELKETKKSFTATFLPQTSTIDSITSLETSSIVLLKEQGITETSQMYISITEQVPTKRTETLYTDGFATTEGKDHTSVFAKLEEEKITETTGVDITETDKMTVIDREQSEMQKLEEITVIEESTELSKVRTAELKETKQLYTDMISAPDFETPEGATCSAETSMIDSITSFETSFVDQLREEGIRETSQMYISITDEVPTKETVKIKSVEVPESTFLSKATISKLEYLKHSTITDTMSEQEKISKLLKPYTVETKVTDVLAITEEKDHTSVFAELEKQKIIKSTEKMPITEKEHSKMQELAEITTIDETLNIKTLEEQAITAPPSAETSLMVEISSMVQPEEEITKKSHVDIYITKEGPATESVKLETVAVPYTSTTSMLKDPKYLIISEKVVEQEIDMTETIEVEEITEIFETDTSIMENITSSETATIAELEEELTKMRKGDITVPTSKLEDSFPTSDTDEKMEISQFHTAELKEIRTTKLMTIQETATITEEGVTDVSVTEVKSIAKISVSISEAPVIEKTTYLNVSEVQASLEKDKIEIPLTTEMEADGIKAKETRRTETPTVEEISGIEKLIEETSDFVTIETKETKGTLDVEPESVIEKIEITTSSDQIFELEEKETSTQALEIEILKQSTFKIESIEKEIDEALEIDQSTIGALKVEAEVEKIATVELTSKDVKLITSHTTIDPELAQLISKSLEQLDDWYYKKAETTLDIFVTKPKEILQAYVSEGKPSTETIHDHDLFGLNKQSTPCQFCPKQVSVALEKATSEPKVEKAVDDYAAKIQVHEQKDFIHINLQTPSCEFCPTSRSTEIETFPAIAVEKEETSVLPKAGLSELESARKAFELTEDFLVTKSTEMESSEVERIYEVDTAEQETLRSVTDTDALLEKISSRETTPKSEPSEASDTNLPEIGLTLSEKEKSDIEIIETPSFINVTEFEELTDNVSEVGIIDIYETLSLEMKEQTDTLEILTKIESTVSTKSTVSTTEQRETELSKAPTKLELATESTPFGIPEKIEERITTSVKATTWEAKDIKILEEVQYTAGTPYLAVDQVVEDIKWPFEGKVEFLEIKETVSLDTVEPKTLEIQEASETIDIMEKIVEMYNQTSSDIEKTTTLANKTTAVEPESASVSLKIDVFKDHEATFETSTRFQKRITDIEKGGFPWVMDEIVSSTIFETSITETEQTEYAMFTEPTDYQVLYYGKDVTSSTKHYLPETSDVETKPKTPTEIDRYGAITSEVAELQISETSESHKMHDVTGMASKKDFYDFVSTKCAICNDEFVLTTSDENALSSLATQIEIEDKEIKETAKEATHTSLVGKVTEKTSHTVDTERTVVSEEDMGEERHFETEIARRDTTYSGDILDSEIQEELDTEAIVTDSVGVAETAITKFGEAEDEATHLESVVGEYSESEELEFEEKEDTDESEEELSTEEEEKELEEDESFEEQTEEEYETTETEEDESCESAEEPSYDEFSTSAMDYTKSLPSVDDDSFIMRQVTEAVVVKRPTRKEHKKKFMRGPTIKDEKLITTEQITAKPLVIVVNDSGRKLGKINETVLEKIANKSASNIDLEYVDLRNISVDLPKRNRSALWVGFPTESCDKEDFEANNNCLCNMEDHLSSLLHKANRKESPKFDIFHCSKFVRPKKGLLIDTMIKPMKRPRRSLIYLQNRSGSEVVEYQNMETLFEDGYKLETSDKNIFALPGSTVEIPCRGKVDRLIHSDHGLHWKFKTSDGTEGEELPETGNLLTLHEVAVKNAGIYTCSKVDKDDAVKVHSHELEVVAFPVYDVRMNVFYVVNVSCDLKDGDILYSYLPKVMAPALCGSANQACFVDVARPRCISRENDNIYNVSISVKIKPDGHFVNSLHELRNCDINCALRFYANIVGLVYKNAEIIQHIPVYSKLPSTSAIEFVPYFSRNPKSPVSTKPPKVAVSCLGGYGLESLKQRVCVVCPKHTFSAADEAFCKSCPAGQYQPERASELCLQCSSPVEDAMCLRMLYSDTNLFKVYVGVAFGVIVLLVVVMLLWSSGYRENHSPHKNIPFEGSLRHRAIKQGRDRDLERGLTRPLLGRRTKTPPDLPPVDF